MSTPDLVLGGLGGDGPIVTGGLGLTGAPDPNAMRATLRGTGALQATLSVATGDAIEATLSGGSSLTGALGAVVGISGTLTGTSTLTGTLTTSVSVSASLSGTSSLTATLVGISVGEMDSAPIEVPWMLAAAVDEAMMAAAEALTAAMHPDVLAEPSAAGAQMQTAHATTSAVLTPTTAGATTAMPTMERQHVAMAHADPASWTVPGMAGAPSATATIERS